MKKYFIFQTQISKIGYFIGMGCGLLLLLTMQISYLFIKVDWDKVAHEVTNKIKDIFFKIQIYHLNKLGT